MECKTCSRQKHFGALNFFGAPKTFFGARGISEIPIEVLIHPEREWEDGVEIDNEIMER